MLNARQTARDVTLPGSTRTPRSPATPTAPARASLRVWCSAALPSRPPTSVPPAQQRVPERTAARIVQRQREQRNTLGALTGAAGAGTSAANSGVNASSTAISDQGNLFNLAGAGATGGQQAQQANLDNSRQQYQSGVSSPYASTAAAHGHHRLQQLGLEHLGHLDDHEEPRRLGRHQRPHGHRGFAQRSSPTVASRPTSSVSGTLDNGLPVYTYRYLGNPQIEMGLMAQDVELVNPEAVEEISGFKAVHYGRAAA
jgi:hypothetical protein